VVDGPVEDPTPAPRPGPSGEATPPTFQGRPLAELALILQPGHPVFLVTSDNGSHDLTKVYWMRGKYNVKEGYDRLGTSRLLHAALDAEEAVLTWSCGRRVHIPRGWYQFSYLPQP
jgi:hypothetical protein